VVTAAITAVAEAIMAAVAAVTTPRPTETSRLALSRH